MNALNQIVKTALFNAQIADGDKGDFSGAITEVIRYSCANTLAFCRFCRVCNANPTIEVMEN